jgi:hypothetical protein
MNEILGHLFTVILDKPDPATEIRLLGKLVNPLEN